VSEQCCFDAKRWREAAASIFNLIWPAPIWMYPRTFYVLGNVEVTSRFTRSKTMRNTFYMKVKSERVK